MYNIASNFLGQLPILSPFYFCFLVVVYKYSVVFFYEINEKHNFCLHGT